MKVSILFGLAKRLKYSGYIDPARDWLVLLTLGAIALAGIVVWNVWAFDTVAQGGVIGAPASSAPPAFSRASLDAIHAVFEKRSAEEAKYETGTYRYSDPSQ
jgi:hypothetical protein